MEDFVYILDYLAQGLPGMGRRPFKKEAIAYGIGNYEFKFLELEPKPGIALQIGERTYIGKDMTKRDKIAHVKRRISYEMLTSAAQAELPHILQAIVKDSAERFVKFYNESAPITSRFHSMQLLPGLGKKTLQSILDERKKAPFKSFADIVARTSLKQPEKSIARKIELELTSQSEKYYLFVPRPKAEE